ncbi:ribokinase [Bradyrhizobium sp. USDA 4524]
MGRVFVAGSINMDVVATAERHPRIGETVAGEAVLYFPGGKGANQAVASAKLGVPTTLIGRLGTDAFGKELRTFLAAQGVDLTFVKDTDGTHSGTAIITLANADNTIVVVPGANGLVEADDVAAPVLARGDVAVSQFEIPLPAIAAFFRRARAVGATTILNPAPAKQADKALLDLVDILVLNETELGYLTGTELRDSDTPERFSEAARAFGARQDRLRHARKARRAGAGRAPTAARAGTRGQGRRHHGSRRLLRRRPRLTARHRQAARRRTGLRQRRRLDLRAADGSRAVDADGG